MKKKQTTANNSLNRKKLYSAFLFINNLPNLEDLLQLKSKEFLKLCEIQAMDWDFSAPWLKTNFLAETKRQNGPFKYTCLLTFKTKDYGSLSFYSSKKITQRKKSFLNKISSFIASTLYSIENKEKISHIKGQWISAFDSFLQAFCITDKNFNIIRCNQAFQKLFQTNKKCRQKNLFKIFPFLIKKPEILEKEGSFLIQGEKNSQEIYWEVSFQTLYLKKENSKTFLFLIKDITEEMKIESLLSNQAKEQELGLIKGSLAHELNNPIAGIKALLGVIEKAVPQKDGSTRESLKDMQKAMDTCHQVVQNLLSASKQKPDRVLDL